MVIQNRRPEAPGGLGRGAAAEAGVGVAPAANDAWKSFFLGDAKTSERLRTRGCSMALIVRARSRNSSMVVFKCLGVEIMEVQEFDFPVCINETGILFGKRALVQQWRSGQILETRTVVPALYGEHRVKASGRGAVKYCFPNEQNPKWVATDLADEPTGAWPTTHPVVDSGVGTYGLMFHPMGMLALTNKGALFRYFDDENREIGGGLPVGGHMVGMVDSLHRFGAVLSAGHVALAGKKLQLLEFSDTQDARVVNMFKMETPTAALLIDGNSNFTAITAGGGAYRWDGSSERPVAILPERVPWAPIENNTVWEPARAHIDSILRAPGVVGAAQLSHTQTIIFGPKGAVLWDPRDYRGSFTEELKRPKTIKHCCKLDENSIVLALRENNLDEIWLYDARKPTFVQATNYALPFAGMTHVNKLIGGHSDEVLVCTNVNVFKIYTSGYKPVGLHPGGYLTARDFKNKLVAVSSTREIYFTEDVGMGPPPQPVVIQ